MTQKKGVSGEKSKIVNFSTQKGVKILKIEEKILFFFGKKTMPVFGQKMTKNQKKGPDFRKKPKSSKID